LLLCLYILGAYFIDLDPTHFHRVMHYLRYGEMDWCELTPFDVKILQKSMDYLNITCPVLPKWNVPESVNSFTFANDFRRVTFMPLNTRQMHTCSVIGDKPVDRIDIRILSTCTSSSKNLFGYWFMRIGFIELGKPSKDKNKPEFEGFAEYGNDSILKSSKSYMEMCPGDVLHIEYDKTGCKIEISRNGNLAIVFDGVPPNLVLCPAFETNSPGASIEVI